MDQYDEDLTQNLFFKSLQNSFSELFEEATNKKHVICIPRAGSLKNFELLKQDIENHILVPIEGRATVYGTHNKKEVNIKSGILTTGSGFEEIRTVPILFEETFFNESDESYRVLCIAQPLAGGDASSYEDMPERVAPLANFQTLEECSEMLWGSTGNVRTQRNLDELIDVFQKKLVKLEDSPLSYLIDASKKLFEKSLEIVFKDQSLKKKAKKNATFMENIRIAAETYITHGVYRKLFKTVCTCMAAKDSNLNKITRNLTAELQLRDLGVRIDFCQNVPRARKEIASLCRYTTPLGKLNCLRRVVSALMRKTGACGKVESMPLTTDDLLPILMFLVVKADMPNWCANFVYMANFRFSGSNSDDEYGFYLATLEAALEHVSSGKLADLNLSTDVSKPFQLATSPSNGAPWQKVGELTTSKSVEGLFQFIKVGNRDAIDELLSPVTSLNQKTPSPMSASPSSSPLCHPLCICEKCATKLAARRLKQTPSLSVYSRDDKGWTVLHIAAYYGHILMTDKLLQKGAVVNSCDLHGTTPLHIACQRGHQAVALLLLHYNAGVNLHDLDGNTALHLATINGHEDCVKALVYCDQGNGLLDLDAGNDFRDTAVHLASKWGYSSILNLLLENGAKVLIRNRKNRLPVHLAHNSRIQQLLMEVGEKEILNRVETVAKVSLRRLSQPVSSRPIVPPTAPVKPPITLPQNTPQRRKSMAKKSSFITEEIKTPSTAEKKLEKLLKAIADGDIHMAKHHLGWTSEWEEEEDVDLSQKPLCHPLCMCEKCQPAQKFTAATELGIHVNLANQQGFTPLHIAALNGHYDLAQLFLKRGAEVNARNITHKSTPLHLASKQDKMDVIKLLIKHGAEVNAKDSQGNTALHYSVVSGCQPKTVFLLQHGAKVNTSNKRGNTPLHQAVKLSFEALVSLLVECGASSTIHNRQNLSPVDLVQSESMAQRLTGSSISGSDTNSVNNSVAEFILSSSSTASTPRDSLVELRRQDGHIPSSSDVPENSSAVNNLEQVLESIPYFDTSPGIKRAQTIDGSSAEGSSGAGSSVGPQRSCANQQSKGKLEKAKTIDKLETAMLQDYSGEGFVLNDPKERALGGGKELCEERSNKEFSPHSVDGINTHYSVNSFCEMSVEKVQHSQLFRHDSAQSKERISSENLQTSSNVNTANMEEVSFPHCNRLKGTDLGVNKTKQSSPETEAELALLDKQAGELISNSVRELDTISKDQVRAVESPDMVCHELHTSHGEALVITSMVNNSQEPPSKNEPDNLGTKTDSDLDSEDSTTESQKDLLISENKI